jgi:hypothetical protein
MIGMITSIEDAIIVVGQLAILLIIPVIVLSMFRTTFYSALIVGRIISIFFAIALWFFSVVIVLNLGGLLWLVVGLLMIGLGPIPIAVGLLIKNGDWEDLAGETLLIVCSIGLYLWLNWRLQRVRPR